MNHKLHLGDISSGIIVF